MNPNTQKVLKFIASILIGIVLLLVASMITIVIQSKKIEQTVQNKINKATSPQSIKINRYDSLTQAKLDTIEVRRSLSHRHVDNLHNRELQSVLDSMYNQIQR